MSQNSNKLKYLKFLAQRKVFICCFLLAAQIALFSLFIFTLRSYLHYYLLISLICSTLFFIYLSNNNQKNEFKIIWFIPVIILPLFGIIAYILFSTDRGSRTLRKQVTKTNELIDPFLYDPKKTNSLKKIYPEAESVITYLADQGNYPPYTDTNIKYYPSGEVFYPDLFNELKKAKEYIFLESFIIEPDHSWNTILNLLQEKIYQGVEVRIICDGFGSTVFSYTRYQNFLRSKGIKSKVFLPMTPVFTTRQNCRDHRKIAVIDGKVAFTGGINISNEYFNYGKNRFNYWKDTAIKLQGQAVKTMTAMFLFAWNFTEKTKEDFQKFLVKNPHGTKQEGLIIPFGDDPTNKKDIAENIYMHFVNTAKKRIYITTPYVILDNEFMNALKFAAQRGIDVRIVVPSVSDHYIPYCIGRTYLKELADEGIKIYIYKDFIHAKTVLKDSDTACVGSINLDYRSFIHHFECGTYLHQVPAIIDIENDFNQLFTESTLLTPEVYKKIPLIQKILGRIFRPFSPLL